MNCHTSHPRGKLRTFRTRSICFTIWPRNWVGNDWSMEPYDSMPWSLHLLGTQKQRHLRFIGPFIVESSLLFSNLSSPFHRVSNCIKGSKAIALLKNLCCLQISELLTRLKVHSRIWLCWGVIPALLRTSSSWLQPYLINLVSYLNAKKSILTIFLTLGSVHRVRNRFHKFKKHCGVNQDFGWSQCWTWSQGQIVFCDEHDIEGHEASHVLLCWLHWGQELVSSFRPERTSVHAFHVTHQEISRYSGAQVQ